METLFQLCLNGLIAGSIYAVAGLGLALVYAVTRFFHFADGAVFTVAPYTAFALAVTGQIPLVFALVAAVLVSILVGCCCELVVYRPLRHSGASATALLVVSLGLYIVLQNAISLLFGDDTKILQGARIQEGLVIWHARVTWTQILIGASGALLIGVLVLFVRLSRVGKQMRAVACDAELAAACGVNTDRIVLVAFAVGSALAGIAGILVSLETNLTPTMGLHVMMMGVAAMIIGGATSIQGIVLGGILLGLARNLGVWHIGSQWQDAIAFGVLLVVLLVRPHGFLGGRTAQVEY